MGEKGFKTIDEQIELRHILLKYLEIIEVQAKSVYAYEFAKVHGPIGYLNSNYFIDKTKHKDIIEKIEKQKEQRISHEPYLKHFVIDLNETIPIWAYVDLMTISDISLLYAISDKSVKRAVANEFGLNMNKGSDILGNYMHSMTIIRNICAHGSRIYNRLFEQRPSLNSKEKRLPRVDENGEIDNAHFYGFLIIMKRLLQPDIFNEMKNVIVSLTKKYPFVRMDYYGFRDDWEEKI